jgi:hypothetical protein
MPQLNINPDRETPAEKEERLKRHPLLGYRFFDTPDGDDCAKKMFYLGKKGTVLGVFWAGMRVYAFQEDKTRLLKTQRFCSNVWGFPAAFVGYG